MEDPYLLGPYAPVDEEIDATLTVVAGEVPRDLHGTYVRNGPNPKRAAEGLHHWFDGDAMLHAVHVEDGQLRYKNRYVRTPALAAEDEAGHALWRGLMESWSHNPKGQPYKDTGNTDVLLHGGELLTLHYIGGVAHRVDPRSLETLGARATPARMSAHAKADPVTGELLYFDYGPRPTMTYGVTDASGAPLHQTSVALPGPRLPHDMAFTERYAILMDLPVWPRPEAAIERKWMVDFHRDTPARFGILPRRGDGADVRWFEADPCYVYHAVNAWEDGDAVVLVGCRCDDPIGTPDPADGRLATAMANLRLRAHLHRWRFDLATGACTEEALDDLNAEFPTMNADFAGRRSRFGYHVTIPDTRTLRFDGVVKYDDGRRVARHAFGDGVYGSEAPFAPRVGATEEDDGYLLTFVQDTRAGASELWIYDARAIERGPITKARVPARVPAGFHATWAPATGGAS
ncbi:MAG: carotenoid oxygenase family protein [Sandaracinaceae bacterium]|nr:carotenoid oxygenase family protein [Sandaracinaceae bacterium]